MLINNNKIFFILLSILPISIVVGSSISLANILLIILLYFFIFIKNRHYEFLYKDKTLRLLLIIYLYLIINSLMSINYDIGLNRNLGFIRFIFFFMAVNYFFFINQKNLRIFNIWVVFFVIFVTDVYFERFSGSNIFGWGAYEINNIKQPHGARVMSFFRDEPIAGAYLNGLFLLMTGYLLTFLKGKNKLKLLLLIVMFSFLFSILLT